MFLFHITFDDYTEVRIASEKVQSTSGYYNSGVVHADDITIGTKSPYGGLVQMTYGNIEITNDFAHTDKMIIVDVSLYTKDGEIPVGQFKGYAIKKTEDTTTYALWLKENNVLLNKDYWLAYGYKDVLSDLLVNDKSQAVNIVYNNIKCSPLTGCSVCDLENFIVVKYVKTGRNLIDLLDEIIKARGCVGVLNDSTLDVYSILSGYKSVRSIESSEFIDFYFVPQTVNSLTIKAETYYEANERHTGYGVYDETWTETVNDFGVDVTVDGYCHWAHSTDNYRDFYKELFSRDVVYFSLPNTTRFDIGDLVYLSNLNEHCLITEVKYSDKAQDVLTYRGVLVSWGYEIITDPENPDFVPAYCPRNQILDSGPDAPASVLLTANKNNRVYVEWTYVDTPIRGLELFDNTTGIYYGGSPTAIQSATDKMTFLFDNEMSSGTHSFSLTINYTTIQNYNFSLTF